MRIDPLRVLMLGPSSFAKPSFTLCPVLRRSVFETSGPAGWSEATRRGTQVVCSSSIYTRIPWSSVRCGPWEATRLKRRRSCGENLGLRQGVGSWAALPSG